jgi:hypothetical protein
MVNKIVELFRALIRKRKLKKRLEKLKKLDPFIYD